MSEISNQPYYKLDPALILNAIESVGYRCSGSLSALNSFENRVYQVGIEDEEALIAKFYRPNRWSDLAIIEEHQFSAELFSHEIPVIAPLVAENGQSLHSFEDFRFALFPRKGGRTLELDNLEQLEWMGRFIGRLHAVGATRNFQHRIHLDIDTYGHLPYKFLQENNFIPVELAAEFHATIEELLKKSREIINQVGTVNYLRLHGDCHAGNVLWHDGGPQIVDLDDCLMGPAIQDLWMLLGATSQDTELYLQSILRGYRSFYDFDRREIKLIEVLRSLRMLHYCAWLARRWEDPAFPINFPWFNTRPYWLDQLKDFKNQVAVLETV